MKKTVYNQKGSKSGDTTLPEDVFSVDWNSDLVHQVVTVMQANERQKLAHAKDRSQKQGSGKKPWRQKGTGRARHGSVRSPLWAGGGVTFGPSKQQDFGKKINKKMVQKALACVLSAKLGDGEIILVDKLEFDEAKTARGKAALDALSEIKGVDAILEASVLILVPEATSELQQVFSNFGNVELDEVRNLNTLQLLQHKYVIIVDPDASLEVLEARVGSKQTATVAE